MNYVWRISTWVTVNPHLNNSIKNKAWHYVIADGSQHHVALIIARKRFKQLGWDSAEELQTYYLKNRLFERLYETRAKPKVLALYIEDWFWKYKIKTE